jgi:hypothetical protein
MDRKSLRRSPIYGVSSDGTSDDDEEVGTSRVAILSEVLHLLLSPTSVLAAALTTTYGFARDSQSGFQP